jgi:MYXO-CTERM domain-containing protein
VAVMFSTKVLVGSVLGLALLSLPALAVPAIPNDGIFQPLDGSTLYTGNQPPTVGAISDTYEFQVTSAFNVNTTTQVQVLAINPPPGIQNLTFTWRNAVTNAFISSLVYTDGTGTATTPANDKLFTLLSSGGLYKLVVTGNGFAGPSGPPHYDFNLSESCGERQGCEVGGTPLPGTMALFGTVFAGGVALLRRRRKVAA